MKLNRISFQSMCVAGACAVCGVGLATSSAFANTITNITDNWSTSYNYGPGSVNSPWSGSLNSANATTFNSNTSNAGELTISATGYGYDAGSKADGPFLFISRAGAYDHK